MNSVEAQMEMVLSIIVLALCAVIASDYIKVSTVAMKSTPLIICIVILALITCSIFPMVGFSLFLLLAVLLFKRNVQTAIQAREPVYKPRKQVSFNMEEPPSGFQHTNTMPSSEPVEVRTENEVYVPHSLPNVAPILNIRGSTNATVETDPLTENPEILETPHAEYGANTIMHQTPHKEFPFSYYKSQPRKFNEFNETDSENPLLGKIVEPFIPANYGDEQGAPIEGPYPIQQERAYESPEERQLPYYPSQEMGTNEFKSSSDQSIDEKVTAITY